jgi:phage shock protein A
MGIFTRFRDIVGSNINAMLDKAEDPEKMIRMMIREMEDCLVDIKAKCAGAMAERKKVERRLAGVREKQTQWEDRARLAVNRGRDNLAREALMEKRSFREMAEALESELAEHGGLVTQYQDDIRQLEEKLGKAQEKKRLLVQRHIRATQSRQAREEIRRAESHETLARFETLENRIERMESEADLVNFGRSSSLEEEFEALVTDEGIESELAELKASRRPAARESGDRANE